MMKKHFQLFAAIALLALCSLAASAQDRGYWRAREHKIGRAHV
jgi:hypothetical protein